MKKNFSGVLITLMFLLFVKQSLAQNSVIIDSGSTWKYWANTQANAPAANWKGGGAFDDSGWPSGQAKLGFGGDGEVTCVPAGCGTLCTPGTCATKYWTTYFRYSFNLANPASYTGFILRVLRDDGAVIYVNGVEVWRTNMPAGSVIYTTPAPAAVGGVDELTFFESPVIPITAFQNGANIIAVEVHQNAQASSDLGFNLQLVGQLTAGTSLHPMGSVWKYWANTEPNAPTVNWKGGGVFDDSGWPSGPGRLGFGDDGEVTCVPAGCGAGCIPGNCGPKFNATYFRTTVNIPNVNAYTGYFINLTRDDGAVIYVNGVEVWRSGMPTGTVVYSTFALTDPLAQSDGPNETAIFTSPAISPSVFLNGTNTIAVEVHQLNTTSSDLGLDLQLMGQVAPDITLLPFGSSWKYWANTEPNAPTINWKGGGAFDDSGWPAGLSKLGFGGDGEITCIPAGCGSGCLPGSCGPKFTTTYFRTTLNIPNVNDYVGFLVNMIRDDGAVLYINGQEAWRTNMPAGAITYPIFASTVDGGTEGQIHSSQIIPVSFFQNGINVIAVEVHQVNSTSSDLGFNLELKGLFVAPSNEVIYMWSGAITPTSAKVNAKLTNNTSQARLVVSTSSSLTSPSYGTYAIADAANNKMAALSISGLSSNTKYYYAVQSDGSTDNSADDIGSFTTSASGAYTFKFTLGGCGLSSNHPVYNKMGEKNPLFFVALGDFHYDNPNSGTDINVHRMPYENNMLSQTASRNFFKNVALAYIWDDHDYSGNDTDSTAAGKTNARLAYQEYVPHYPLARGSGDVPIYQSFTIGRIHFIMTDLRSTRKQGVSIWNDIQKDWFKAECLYAKNNNLTIAWVSSVSFGGNQADNWGGFTAQRTEISDFLKNNNIVNMFIMSGDAHMLAMDNGVNHDFSTGASNSFDYPVFASAALNQSGSVKGGVYNVRPDGTVDPSPAGNGYTYPNPSSSDGQYGLVQITDNGSSNLCITFTGYRVNNSGVETQLSTFNFCRTIQSPLPIKISSFKVKVVDKRNAELNWVVSEQTNCSKYVVERSTDGISFTEIATVSCYAGDSYTYTDNDARKGWNYYRIKMTELSNAFTYSEIRKVFISGIMNLEIAPNPVRNNLIFKLNNIVVPGKALYTVYDAIGKQQLQGELDLFSGSNQLTIAAGKLSPGLYILKMIVENTEVKQQFIVQ